MRRLVFFALLTLLSVIPAAAQESIAITIFRDKDSFTLYLPDGGSVANLALEISSDGQGKFLSEYPDLSAVPLDRLIGPICIRFERSSQNILPLPACERAAIFVQPLEDGNLFWFDDATHQPRPVPVFSGVRIMGVCPGKSMTCDITFTQQAETSSADACPNPADIENYEVLVLVANFDTNTAFTTIRWPEILGEVITPEMKVRVQPLSRIIRSDDEARAQMECFKATLAIWGKIDLSGVETHFSAKSWWGDVDSLPPRTPKEQTKGVIDHIVITRPLTSDTIYLADFLRANLLYFGEDTGRALPAIEQAMESAPSGNKVNSAVTVLEFYKGCILWAVLDEPKEAAVSFSDFIFFDPNSPYLAKAYYRRGKAYLDDAQYGLALSDFDKVISLQPDNVWAYSNRGVAYYYLGVYDMALADYNQAISLDPTNEVAYYNRGLVYDVQGDLQHAADDYTQAITLAPDYAEAYYNRGTVYKKQGDAVRAAADFEQAAMLAPGDLAALLNQGVAYFEAGDYASAVDAYTQAITESPEFSLAYYNRANAYYAQGDFEKAGDDYQQAVDLNPGNANAFYGLGNVLIQKGDDKAATLAYTRAIELDPLKPDFYFQRGLSYYHQLAYKHAVDDFSQVIDLQPERVEAYKLRAASYTQYSEFDKALADYTTLIDIRDDAESFADRGTFYMSRDEFDEAIDDFSEAISLAPDDAEMYYNRANAYVQKSNYASAIEDFEAAIRLKPDYPEAIKGREFAYAAQGSTPPPLETTPELAD